MEGLVIDDYFSIGIHKRGSNDRGLDSTCFSTAQAAYASAGLTGSPSKDVVGQRIAKVIGASINAGPFALSRGVAT